MDKLRAIEYFVQVVEAGSFSAAARQMEVTPPAVTKLVASLEAELGVQLLRRSSRRVILTPDGDRYLKACGALLNGLRAVEQGLGNSAVQAEGKLVVGVSRTIAANVLMPQFGRLRSRHPELHLDLRTINYAHEPAASLCDVLLLIGWQEDSDWIAQMVARGRHSVLASPGFWAEHGKPADPADLVRYPCLAHRVPRGVVVDRWKFRRGDEARSVPLEPVAVFDDRDSLAEAAARGHGVMFGNDVTLLRWLEAGALEVGMMDWVGLEAPPVHLMYRRGGRSSARVRAFADFITGLFAETMRQRNAYGPPDTTGMPDWFHSRYTGRLAGRFA